MVLRGRQRHGQDGIDDAVGIDDQVTVPGGRHVERIQGAGADLPLDVLLGDRGARRGEERNRDHAVDGRQSHGVLLNASLRG